VTSMPSDRCIAKAAQRRGINRDDPPRRTRGLPVRPDHATMEPWTRRRRPTVVVVETPSRRTLRSDGARGRGRSGVKEG
jgi:hypothetical protein